MIVNIYNPNEFFFSIVFMAPTYIVAIGLQVLSFCKDGEDGILIEGETISCASFQFTRVYRATVILFMILFAHYVVQYQIV